MGQWRKKLVADKKNCNWLPENQSRAGMSLLDMWSSAGVWPSSSHIFTSPWQKRNTGLLPPGLVFNLNSVVLFEIGCLIQRALLVLLAGVNVTFNVSSCSLLFFFSWETSSWRSCRETPRPPMCWWGRWTSWTRPLWRLFACSKLWCWEP